MKSSTALTIAAIVGSAVAGPLSQFFPRQAGACLTESEAEGIVEIYRKLIAEYTPELGEKYTTTDFVDTSDSINTFIHQKLGGPTFPTKAVFLEVQLQNPPFPVEIISVDAVACASVALQWKATFGAAQLPSKGITIVKTAKEGGEWKIKSIDVEFNGLAWLLNMGGSYSWEGETYDAENIDPTITGAAPAPPHHAPPSM